LLLIAAALLLVVPCFAAARFALSFDTAAQEPADKQQLKQKLDAEQREKQKRTVLELMQQADALKEKIQRAPQSERAAIESRLLEVQRNLEEHKRMLEQYAVAKERLALSDPAVDVARQHAVTEMLETAQRLEGKNLKARLIYHVEPDYPADAREKKIEGSVVIGFTVNHEGIPQNMQVKKPLYPSLDQAAVQAVSKWRFEPAMKNGELVSMWLEAQVNFNLNQELQIGEALKFKARMSSDERRAEEEQEVNNRADLARQAKISMDQAIQIATSKVPGKVLECTLVGERRKEGEFKPTQALYRVVVLGGDESNTLATYVWISALDGSVVRTEKEERKRENPEALSFNRSTEKALNGGVLNGKATSLPAPEYPSIAREARVSGSVNVEVLIDEAGNVVGTGVYFYRLVGVSGVAPRKMVLLK
jgi:TonB family protein